MNKDEYRYTDTLFKRSQLVSPETGEGFAAKVRAVVADHSRQLQGTFSKAKQAQGRFTQGMAGKKRTLLPGGVLVETWINPFGLVPTLVARVVFPKTEEEEEPTVLDFYGFIFAPTSEEALYSWGSPYYDDNGIPINPPLGTPLVSPQHLDASYNQYRLVSDDTGDWAVTHNQRALGGRLWKKTSGRTISWGPVAGAEGIANISGDPIYYAGRILAAYPDRTILAANFNSGTLFALVASGDTLYIATCPVDWVTGSSSNTWTTGPEFTLPEDHRLDNVREFGLADINHSCTEAVLLSIRGSNSFSAPWKGAEIKIEWDSDLVVTCSITSRTEDTISEPNGPWTGSGIGVFTRTPVPFVPSDEGENWAAWCGVYPDYAVVEYNEEANYIGICESEISVKYKEDTDDLTRLTLRWEVNKIIDKYWVSIVNWCQPFNDGVWFPCSGSYTADFYDLENTSAKVLLDGVSQASYLLYKKEFNFDESSSSDSTIDGGCVTTTGTGSYTNNTTTEEYKLAVHQGLAEAREAGFVSWYACILNKTETYSGGFSGYVDDCDGCTPILLPTTSTLTEDKSQEFKYHWENSSGVNETRTYNYTESDAFVSDTFAVHNSFLDESLMEFSLVLSLDPWHSTEDYDLLITLIFPTAISEIVLRNGVMGTIVNDLVENSAALWAPDLALVQNWVRESAENDKVSLPYWNSGDLLALASVTGGNQAISPQWGVGIMGVIGKRPSE